MLFDCRYLSHINTPKGVSVWLYISRLHKSSDTPVSHLQHCDENPNIDVSACLVVGLIPLLYEVTKNPFYCGLCEDKLKPLS